MIHVLKGNLSSVASYKMPTLQILGGGGGGGWGGGVGGIALLLGNYYVSGMETMLGVQRLDSRHRVHCYQLRADLDEVACGGRGERGAASFILLFEVSPVPNLTLM